uniref:C2H2-type domain-containing protein n=1 Tax=Anopheles funestus TaxID=62324 RepID=A0A182RLV2_ANOFN
MDAEVSANEQAPHQRQTNSWQYYADNFNRLCRLCLSQDGLVAIYYNVQGRNVYFIRNFVKLALDLLQIKINKHDALPAFLCVKCERNLKIITNFKRKCDESMKMLSHIRDTTNKRDRCEPVYDALHKKKRRRKEPTKRLKQDCAAILKKSHVNGVHLRKRDFKCDICGKAFLEKNNLKGHMRIHNGDRKYACSLCSKTFLFAGTLRCHVLTHTQESSTNVRSVESCSCCARHLTNICAYILVKGHTVAPCVINDSGPRHIRWYICVRIQVRNALSCRICGMCFAHHKGRSVHMKAKHPQELV